MMNKLTEAAKKTYLTLIGGNLLVIFALVILFQYSTYVNVKPLVAPTTVHALNKMIRSLKLREAVAWPNIISQQTIPWSKITVSPMPLYQENALLNFQPLLVFDLLKQNKKLEISVLLKEGSWLNITMTPPVPSQFWVWLTLGSLFLMILIAFLLINYWAIKTLNQPIQTLLQSLSYSEDQANWSPIPVTGNSDQKQIFAKINLLQEKVHRLLDNRTKVVTAISHDLRTPLTRLKLRLESLEDTPNFAKMMHDITDMETMIRETLDYFADVSVSAMNRFDFVAMLNSLVLDAQDLRFDVKLETKLNRLIYFGNVNLLKRAISNLLNNALQYGKQAVIHLQSFEQYIEMVIEDNGPGLNPQDLEQVFKPFYRGEQSRSRTTGGTGLGLTIAKEIIQKHQGSITLNNRPQTGLQVCIVLPKLHELSETT